MACVKGVLSGGGLGIDGVVASRLLLEAMMTYEQDWLSVSTERFNFPWDMVSYSPTRKSITLSVDEQNERTRTRRFLACLSACLFV